MNIGIARKTASLDQEGRLTRDKTRIRPWLHPNLSRPCHHACSAPSGRSGVPTAPTRRDRTSVAARSPLRSGDLRRGSLRPRHPNKRRGPGPNCLRSTTDALRWEPGRPRLANLERRSIHSNCSSSQTSPPVVVKSESPIHGKTGLPTDRLGDHDGTSCVRSKKHEKQDYERSNRPGEGRIPAYLTLHNDLTSFHPARQQRKAPRRRTPCEKHEKLATRPRSIESRVRKDVTAEGNQGCVWTLITTDHTNKL